MFQEDVNGDLYCPYHRRNGFHTTRCDYPEAFRGPRQLQRFSRHLASCGARRFFEEALRNGTLRESAIAEWRSSNQADAAAAAATAGPALLPVIVGKTPLMIR